MWAARITRPWFGEWGINGLLMGKLSDALDDKQKDNKIANLLTNLRRKGRICNTGSRGHPVWKLAE